MKDSFYRKTPVGLILGAVCGSVWLASIIALDLAAESTCLEEGYSEHRITFLYDMYCVDKLTGKTIDIGTGAM